MREIILPLLIITIIALNSCTLKEFHSKSISQIDSLANVKKLTYKDVFYTNENAPANLSFIQELRSPSIQGRMFYDINESYVGIALPNLRYKKYQTFYDGDDIGSVMYFEYDGNVSVNAGKFIDALLYGEKNNPYDLHPEEYLIHKNIIILWGFKLNSKVKKMHQNYLTSILKNK
jgi:hypothetical protein